MVDKLSRKTCCCDVVEKKGVGWDGGKSAQQLQELVGGNRQKERATGQPALAVIG